MTKDYEIDAIVADRIFGCSVRVIDGSGDPHEGRRFRCGCADLESDDIGPHSDPNALDGQLKSYSTDISAAWEIVEYRIRNRKDQTFCLVFNPVTTMWSCGSTGTQPESWPFSAHAPLAICMAALKLMKDRHPIQPPP